MPLPCASGVTCGPAASFDVANENLVLYQLGTVAAGAPPAPAGAWNVLGCRLAVNAPQFLGPVSSLADCINLATAGANMAYLALTIPDGPIDFNAPRSCRGAPQA